MKNKHNKSSEPTMEGIEGLVALFREFGGKFENVALGYREESGFYCYTLDSNQDSFVSCPAHLLVDSGDVDINQDGLFITSPEKYGEYREFLEEYFAFHFNKKMLDNYVEKKRQIDSLSDHDLSLISRIIPPTEFMADKYGDLEFAKQQIFQSHWVHYFGKEVFMPFMSFLNHAKNGSQISIEKEAISVSGKFSSEVFARYNVNDVLLIAGGYGFITDTSFVFSLPMTIEIPNGPRIVIERIPRDSAKTRDGLRWPLINQDGGTITISWFPMYFEDADLYPARVAQMITQKTGLSAETLLCCIFQNNLNALITVAFQLRDSDNPFAQMIAAAAQRQLEVLGGTRNG